MTRQKRSPLTVEAKFEVVNNSSCHAGLCTTCKAPDTRDDMFQIESVIAPRAAHHPFVSNVTHTPPLFAANRPSKLKEEEMGGPKDC